MQPIWTYALLLLRPKFAGTGYVDDSSWGRHAWLERLQFNFNQTSGFSHPRDTFAILEHKQVDRKTLEATNGNVGRTRA